MKYLGFLSKSLPVFVAIAIAPAIVFAANEGDSAVFIVEENFDALSRSQVQAVLVRNSPSLYFYAEESLWDRLDRSKRGEMLANLDSLSKEFSGKIYPALTSVFGYEWKPGIDGDEKITILFHSLKNGVSGYFRSVDEYLKIQAPFSNEKEMIYIDFSHINESRLKTFVAHEFVHLITFNQKNRLRDVEEDVWLNEARAEYGLTILGYNAPYEGSGLQKRARDFARDPSDSLTEWQENKSDYAVANMFVHYLADHYGANILSNSMKSEQVGIASINEALRKNGTRESFAQIFTDWTIAMAVGSCAQNEKHCYLNPGLKNFTANPAINFLPVSGNSSLSVMSTTKNWAGNWQKIIGGNGNLTLEFSVPEGLSWKIPYVVFGKNDNYSVNFIHLDENRKGKIEIKNFGDNYSSLIIIPSLQSKLDGFSGTDSSRIYNFIVSTSKEPSLDEEQKLIQELLRQIEELKRQIAAFRSGSLPPDYAQSRKVCSAIAKNLYLGLSDNEVRCLQQFLMSQGVEIYPEGLVTGYFGNLTKSAVIRFQEKYKSEILTPIGLEKGTGFVGTMTRGKINQLLK